MKLQGVKKTLGLLTIAAMLVVMGAGCTKYASEEDLQGLESRKQAALSAEKQVQKLEGEVKTTEQTLDAKKAELEAVRAEKAVVAERLQKMEASSDAMKTDGEGK